MKVIFFGTPQFSSIILESLYADHDILAIVTQPDESKKVSPVKSFALEHDIKLFQPKKVKNISEHLIKLNPDIYITAAFGQFIPNNILDHKPSINVHASLLPAYRGAAPIQYALKDGLNETGITIMYMVKEMDAGNILAKKVVPIQHHDHATSLTLKLSHEGASLLRETLTLFHNQRPLGEIQNPDEITFAPKWQPKDELVHLDMNCQTFLNYVRANAMTPGATLRTDACTLKIYEAIKNDIIQPDSVGKVFISKSSLSLSLIDGVIDITTIQLPGKKKMPIKDFLNGQKNFLDGMILKER
ncbi:MAG: methionyl-tRNA formyltransferase [Acholeplasmataceae bacterium]